jgi:glycerol-3-phosphate dehydrogenase (NAD(P)+)
VWARLAEHCPQAAGVCSVTKGVENATLFRPTQILQDVLGPAHTGPLAALSGPSIAPEILNRCPASVAVASADTAFAGRIQQEISRSYFRVYTNPDPLGVELAGATKNVIAIAAGVLDGLEAGNNAKAALLTRGLTEITRLGVAMGAQAETFAGLAGFGDLVTTCFSPVGRNRTFGEAIGRGKTVAEALEATESVVEGVPTTRSVMELAERHQVEMPITQAIAEVLFEHKPARDAIHDLMNRPLKSEQ